MARRGLYASHFLALVGVGVSIVFGSAPAHARSYDLPAVLELTDRNFPNVVMARARLLQARAQLDEARFAPFSQFKLTGGIGLAPTVRGTNVFSPNTDVSLTSSLGVAWRA